MFAGLETSAPQPDTITDFVSGVDRLAFDREVFSAFEGENVGPLDARAFVFGTTAASARQYLVYDRAVGQLWYDATGSGGGAQVLIAALDPGAALIAGDIVLV